MYIYRIGETDDFLYWDKGRGLYGIVYDGNDSEERSDLVQTWYGSLDEARDEWEAKRGAQYGRRTYSRCEPATTKAD